MTGPDEEPTGHLGPDDEPETEALPPDNEAETNALPKDDPATEALPDDGEPETATIDSGSTHETESRPSIESPPPPPGAGGTDSTRNRGLITLAVSILASLLLVGIYLAAGGLDYKPAKAADPCDSRPWTDPGNLEESVQQFAISAVDGAACELGVSREELTRALADDASRQEFADENGLSDSDVEDALRKGLDRAVDDAENAGALSPLAATGARAAISVAPMSVLISLIENSEQFFQEGFGGINSVDDAINAITDAIGGVDSGTISPDSGATGDTGTTDGGTIEELIPQELKDQLDSQLPKGTRKDLQNQAEDAIRQGLDGLINP